MEECIFCNIVSGKLTSYKIREDEFTISFLEIFPFVEYQALCIPKIHFDSSFVSFPEEYIKDMMISAKETALLLENKTGASRTIIVIEGLGVNHFHIKLIPYLSGEKNIITTTFTMESEESLIEKQKLILS